MRLLFAGLIFCSVLYRAEAHAGENVQITSNQNSLRAYPGGRDESDLTVQPKRKVVRKSEDLDLEQFESESTEVASPQSAESFGE